jgi:hypothetical protein
VSTPSEKKGLAALVTGEGTGKDHPLWKAIGGLLGLIETILPGFVFVIVFAISSDPWLAIWVSVSTSALFALYRIVRRQPLTQAFAGFLAVIASALLATISNRPEDNFVLGLITNSVYATAFLISILVRWPIIGIAVGFLRSEGTSWRKNPHHMRVYTGLTALWLGMFSLRVFVILPLYLAGDVGTLSWTRLLLGLPLYVPILAVTWLIVRTLKTEKISE